MSASSPSRLSLPAGSLVVADLHLDCERDEDLASLEGLLAACADAPALVILGDLFEYWLGRSHAEAPGGRRALAALAGFPGELHLVPGNRDVLAGAELAEALGTPLLFAGALVTTPAGAAPWLLLHGDELCTSDHGYQRLRRLLRRPLVARCLRGLPSGLAHFLAARLRAASRKAVPAKAPLTVAQDLGEADRRVVAASARGLLVGHAHAFRGEQLASGASFHVLDAFGGQHDLARFADDGGLEFLASRDLAALRE